MADGMAAGWGAPRKKLESSCICNGESCFSDPSSGERTMTRASHPDASWTVRNGHTRGWAAAFDVTAV